MNRSRTRGFPVQVDYSPNEFLSLHRTFLDLTESIGHGIVFLQHAMVKLTDGEDARHKVAEVMYESIG